MLTRRQSKCLMHRLILDQDLSRIISKSLSRSSLASLVMTNSKTRKIYGDILLDRAKQEANDLSKQSKSIQNHFLLELQHFECFCGHIHPCSSIHKSVSILINNNSLLKANIEKLTEIIDKFYKIPHKYRIGLIPPGYRQDKFYFSRYETIDFMGTLKLPGIEKNKYKWTYHVDLWSIYDVHEFMKTDDLVDFCGFTRKQWLDFVQFLNTSRKFISENIAVI
jgi:hypothetical protein